MENFRSPPPGPCSGKQLPASGWAFHRSRCHLRQRSPLRSGSSSGRT
nr:MAG TPA: hypothetical protein [Caudoviricetes sp.]